MQSATFAYVHWAKSKQPDRSQEKDIDLLSREKMNGVHQATK
jgi:hypothetical protein